VIELASSTQLVVIACGWLKKIRASSIAGTLSGALDGTAARPRGARVADLSACR
jgi:hypothetical protein